MPKKLNFSFRGIPGPPNFWIHPRALGHGPGLQIQMHLKLCLGGKDEKFEEFVRVGWLGCLVSGGTWESGFAFNYDHHFFSFPHVLLRLCLCGESEGWQESGRLIIGNESLPSSLTHSHFTPRDGSGVNRGKSQRKST
jgi:hypothetical protein